MAINFGENLKRIRTQKNISQGELAGLLDMHATHLSRYERNVTAPSIEVLKKLADVLGVTTDMLIYGTTEDKVKNNIQDQELLNLFTKVQALDNEDIKCVKSFLGAFVFRKDLTHQLVTK